MILRIKNGSIKHKSKVLFENLFFDLQLGERVALLGRNGSGKSSLIKSIIKANKYFKGEVFLKPNINIALVLQDINFFGTVKMIFEKYCFLLNIKNELEKWLTFFDIKNCINSDYRLLSKGQKQKINLIIAFLRKPDFIIIDEITTSLDNYWRIKIIDDIKKMLIFSPNISLLLISHDENEITELCEKYVMLKDKKLSQKSNIDTNNKLDFVINLLESL